MKNERRFCKCSRCGNIISFINNAGPGLICCGEKMQELAPNTTDAAQEKHVPSGKRENGKLIVTVGSVNHPMTDEHHIAWIVAVDGNRTQRVVLSSAQEPAADFSVGGDPVTVYAYCNLHGLWTAQL